MDFFTKFFSLVSKHVNLTFKHVFFLNLKKLFPLLMKCPSVDNGLEH